MQKKLQETSQKSGQAKLQGTRQACMQEKEIGKQARKYGRIVGMNYEKVCKKSGKEIGKKECMKSSQAQRRKYEGKVARNQARKYAKSIKEQVEKVWKKSGKELGKKVRKKTIKELGR